MTYFDFTDSELVSLLKKDDQLAYNEIYQRYKWVLFLHAIKRIRNREEAKDIVQELFVTLWDKRKELDLTGHLSGYLYTAVRNRVIKFISHQQVASVYISSLGNSISAGICITDHRIRESNLAAIIEREIQELPEKMKEVFILSRRHNLSHKEIAAQLGIEETTVKRQVSNALKILRTKLGLFVWLIFLIKY
ncbi:MAG TPA: RNA polymerase sigma-70 factor [Pedobacter sp.]